MPHHFFHIIRLDQKRLQPTVTYSRPTKTIGTDEDRKNLPSTIMTITSPQVLNEYTPPRQLPSPLCTIRSILRFATRSRIILDLQSPSNMDTSKNISQPEPDTHLPPRKNKKPPTRLHSRAATSKWVLTEAPGLNFAMNYRPGGPRPL